MYSFSYLEPVCCSMSSSNCCFLTCIQISQEAGQVVCYSHLLKNFSQFVVIYTVKGFGIVNKEKVDAFLELLLFQWFNGYWQFDLWFLCLFQIQLEHLEVHSSHTAEGFWRILSITFLACEMSAIVQYFEHSLALLFFGIGMKTDLFQSCGHCWVFQICWHSECSTFTESSFRIWNSSTEIPSPPLALFVVMLSKGHLS